MTEHRLIERMIALMRDNLQKIKKENKAEVGFIDTAIDFIRTYADRCHHGKEEDILFRDLAKKPISDEHKKIMNELIEEHGYGRKAVGSLVSAKEKYAKGDTIALKDIISCLEALVAFYPMHIEKEDKRFFLPCMDYFTDEEKDNMLKEYWEFDKKLIHEHYKKTVEALEKG